MHSSSFNNNKIGSARSFSRSYHSIPTTINIFPICPFIDFFTPSIIYKSFKITKNPNFSAARLRRAEIYIKFLSILPKIYIKFLYILENFRLRRKVFQYIIYKNFIYICLEISLGYSSKCVPICSKCIAKHSVRSTHFVG